MSDVKEFAKACAVIRDTFKNDPYFRDAFIASIESGYKDAVKHDGAFRTDREIAEDIAKRIFDIE